MHLAFYDLKQHRGRFIATVFGVGLLFTIVLAMNGLYRGNIYEGLALINATNPDLWVVERYRGGPFNEQSTVPEFYHYSVKAIPGVEKASPFIYYTVERPIAGKSRHFSIIGYDVFGGLGGPQKIFAGRNIEHAHYEMVAHPKLGVHVGDRVPLGLHTYTVVGLTKEAISSDGEALVYLSLPDAQEVLYQRDDEEIRNQRERLLRTLSGQSYLSPNQADKLLAPLQSDTHIINAVLVRLKPGTNRAEVGRMIDKWLYLSAYSTEDELQLMLKGRLASMAKQLLLFRTLLLIISVVIVSLVVYTFTMEKIRSIAVMKLIGAPDRVIVRMVMEQSLLLTIGAFLFGLILIQNTYQMFPRTILRIPGDDLLTFGFNGWHSREYFRALARIENPACHGPGWMMEILRIEGLTKVFGSGRLEVRALQDINLSVSKGELVALLGPSGSGKTTLLLCISLILVPTAGKVVFGG